MGRETSKSHDRRARNGDFKKYFAGRGVDIGCGNDPVLPNCQRFDKEYGDAQYVKELDPGSFDYVYSSHCLEHIRDWEKALKCWWSLLKGGGYMILVVPEFAMYEKRTYEFKFNTDHKDVFHMKKLLDSCWHLPMAQVLRAQINEDGFDYSDKTTDQTRYGAQAEIEIICRKAVDPFWSYSGDPEKI